MQVSIFAVNYGGWPHMQSLRENKKLFGALAVAYAVIWICISDTFPPLNDALEVGLGLKRRLVFARHPTYNVAMSM